VSALDRTDFQILTALQDDGRRSLTSIARDLGVSVGTVRNRVARLRRAGTLHVTGRADPHHVGFRAPANIHVAVRPPHLTDAAAELIAALPEVSYVAITSGERSLELDVMCRDVAHLTEFLTKRLHAVPGVVDASTNLVLRVVKYGQPDLRLVDRDGESDTEEETP
jgi:Lrp/AsnC family transcriptional regulator, regulator for asnA, asnC and gidA